MKKQEGGGQIEEVFLFILQKVKEHDNVLGKVKENVLMLNRMKTFHTMFIQFKSPKWARGCHLSINKKMVGGLIKMRQTLLKKLKWGFMSCQDVN